MTKNNGRKGLWAFVVLVCALLGFAVDQVRAWPVPDTGQTTSYAVGDDGYYSPRNPHSYTDNGDGTVTDNVTKLMWQQQDHELGYTTKCEDLNLGGYNDWRLPTVLELSFLINRSKYSPAIDQAFFPSAKSDYYEASSVLAEPTTIPWENWKVTFNGKILQSATDTWSMPGYTRCVRGETSSSFGKIVVNNEDTATDNNTGLTWQRQDDGEVKSWNDALTYCEGLSLGGFSDWRLPTVNELQSIVDYSAYKPSIDSTTYPNTHSWYWSSTTVAKGPSEGGAHDVWEVSFYYGTVSKGNKTYKEPVNNFV